MNSNSSVQIAAPIEVRRASYVAWLLRLDPHRIFPLGPESNVEADFHLFESVQAILADLNHKASSSQDTSPRALWFRQTLDYCNDVMCGKVNPENNAWFENRNGYRRGVYVFLESEE